MLDMLPKEIWSDKKATFLDPACKSGVFLREIAKRLIEAQLPNYEQIAYDINEKLRAGGELDGRDIAFQNMLEDVIEHVFKNQIFGIAITELTSLLSRRSVYCSKYPQSEYSVVHFDNPEGRIDYKQMQHTWKNGKCVYCGASEGEYDREGGKEQYAYEFIHLDNPEEVFDMKFDVIIGNPPYQLSDGGAQQSASPVYQKFIEQAMKLNPRYISMIVPARWYSGGKGLDDFRDMMLGNNRISMIHDFPETSDCFPGVNIRGGICYFLWERDYRGDCHVINYKDGKILDESFRPLKEKNATTFIRYNKAIDILNKVTAFHEPTMDVLVSSRKPFGLATNYSDYSDNKTADKPIELYKFRKNGWIGVQDVEKNHDWVNAWKIFEPYASPGQDDYPHLILSKPIVAGPETVCTETYLVIGPFEDESIASNVATYLSTKFLRFMLLLLKSAQHITQKVYAFAPQQDFSKPWTDEELYEKYGITDEEQAFIDSLIKPMDLDD